jgi:nuclear protein localization family protein 4
VLQVAVEDDIYSKLPQIAEKVPDHVNLSTIIFSNKPFGGDMRTPESLNGVTFAQVGFG